MRLICPSCAAEYEIDATAIGENGRTVRCASCASEWFQQPERSSVSDAAAAVEAAARRPRPTVIVPEPRRASPPPESPAIEGDPAEEVYFEDESADYNAGAIEEPRSPGRQPPHEADALTAALRGEDDEDDRSGGAFLAGFATVTLIGLAMLAAYVKAPELGALAPALKAPLAAYAELVDQGRAALAALVGEVMAGL